VHLANSFLLRGYKGSAAVIWGSVKEFACKYDIQHCMIQNEELTDLSESVVAVVEEWQGWI
jgi:hypothetical protein